MRRLRYFLWGNEEDLGGDDDISASSQGVTTHVAMFAGMCAYTVLLACSHQGQDRLATVPTLVQSSVRLRF